MEVHFTALIDAGFPYRYLSYRLKARHRSGRGIHPPFAYQFIRQVFFGESVPNLEFIEQIRRGMRSDSSKVRVLDHGAGSRTGTKEDRRIRDLVRHTAISPKYGQVLARLVCILRPKSVIELGTGTGIASLYMRSADPGVKIITCEGCRSIAGIAEKNFRRAGVFDIDLRIGKFESLLVKFHKVVYENLVH